MDPEGNGVDAKKRDRHKSERQKGIHVTHPRIWMYTFAWNASKSYIHSRGLSLPISVSVSVCARVSAHESGISFFTCFSIHSHEVRMAKEKIKKRFYKFWRKKGIHISMHCWWCFRSKAITSVYMRALFSSFFGILFNIASQFEYGWQFVMEFCKWIIHKCVM